MVVSIQGKRMYLWRAVDSEGEILDLLIQPKRDKAAALRLMRKLIRKHGYAPQVLVTDKLRSYGAAYPTNPRQPAVCGGRMRESRCCRGVGAVLGLVVRFVQGGGARTETPDVAGAHHIAREKR